MTNEELKEAIKDALEIARDETDRPKFQEVSTQLQSGHIFVGQWRTDVNDAPLEKTLLVSTTELVEFGSKNKSTWVTFGGESKVNAFAELPAPPKQVECDTCGRHYSDDEDLESLCPRCPGYLGLNFPAPPKQIA